MFPRPCGTSLPCAVRACSPQGTLTPAHCALEPRWAHSFTPWRLCLRLCPALAGACSGSGTTRGPVSPTVHSAEGLGMWKAKQSPSTPQFSRPPRKGSTAGTCKPVAARPRGQCGAVLGGAGLAPQTTPSHPPWLPHPPQPRRSGLGPGGRGQGPDQAQQSAVDLAMGLK